MGIRKSVIFPLRPSVNTHEMDLSTPIKESIIKKKQQQAFASQPFSNFVNPIHKLNLYLHEKNT